MTVNDDRSKARSQQLRKLSAKLCFHWNKQINMAIKCKHHFQNMQYCFHAKMVQKISVNTYLTNGMTMKKEFGLRPRCLHVLSFLCAGRCSTWNHSKFCTIITIRFFSTLSKKSLVWRRKCENTQQWRLTI